MTFGHAPVWLFLTGAGAIALAGFLTVVLPSRSTEPDAPTGDVAAFASPTPGAPRLPEPRIVRASSPAIVTALDHDALATPPAEPPLVPAAVSARPPAPLATTPRRLELPTTMSASDSAPFPETPAEPRPVPAATTPPPRESAAPPPRGLEPLATSAAPSALYSPRWIPSSRSLTSLADTRSVRSEPKTSGTSDHPSEGASQNCAGCGRSLALRESWRTCSQCGRSICRECLGTSLRTHGRSWCGACGPPPA
jgi:hypothetical protein